MIETDETAQEPNPRLATGINRLAPATLRWHESWVVRAAAITIFILACGYISSVLIAIQGIKASSQLVHSPDVEAALNANMEGTKTSYRLRKELVLTRLQATRPDPLPGKPSEVLDWLRSSGISEYISIENLTIVARDKPSSEIIWLGQQEIALGSHNVTFPHGQAFADFKQAQDVLQRYQLIGENLENKIIPTLVRANTLVLFLTFLLLIASFFVLARRLKRSIEQVLEGFAYWADVNSKFRFNTRWSGELKLITSQFNAMANDVEANRKRSMYLEKVASWQTIARKLAHEIKNPLTPIQMMVSQLSRRYQGDDPEFKKLLSDSQEIINEEVGGLRRMVETFSKFARLPEPKRKKQEIAAALRRVVDLQKNAFEHHNLSFETTKDEVYAEVDMDLIRQVIINLVKNAAEACAETPAEIRVRLEDKTTEIVITVEDTGPGIPREMLRNVFEAYFTTKHTGPSPGMGLGLAICQKIILDHHGEVKVESRPGHTEFTIRIPKDEQGSL